VVAPTIDPLVSRITLVTNANLPEIEQIEKQLRKLINVIKLRDLSGKNAVKREMALICVKAKPENRAEVLRIVSIFRCKVVDTGLEHYIIEVSGNEDKINAFINLLKPMGIKKIARTGALALFREPN
jgi:acetolactate synthase-1/3 small subunit